ncbi:hypothetical protein INT47_007567 [Mucor saturninus]|uniref:Uncharacterized protein n=1 Tax=Mucor saturninus TaxID=64648 RepID=A0A8H7V1N0_9FUNG|nr:hypothetical protein INT47_007567 [Mucor saturninus]
MASQKYFKLPFKWQPSHNIITKSLLEYPSIINMIVCALVDKNIPVDTYMVAPIESPETTTDKNMYTLYVSKNEISDKWVPVLVVVQETVDHVTMGETIKRCLLVYEERRISPTVLIISLKDSLSVVDWGQFDEEDAFFLQKIQCSYWSEKCLVFFPNPLNDDSSVPSLTAFCQFISNTKKTFSSFQDIETGVISLTCKTAKP